MQKQYLKKIQFCKFKILTENLSTIPYVTQYIKYWLSNRFFFNVQEYICENLLYLLNEIYLSKLKWSYIKLIKFSCLFSFNKENIFIKNKLYYIKLIKSFLFNSQQIKDVVQKFFKIVKLKFYKKDDINRLRLRKDFNWLLIIKIIIKKLQYYYCLYKQLFNRIHIHLITFKINNLLLYLKINQDYNLVKNLKYYIKIHLYNLLYKKNIYQDLCLSLFKVTR